MELTKAIQSRKSVRKFSTKKPDWRDIIECIDAARYAPMAGNNFSLKFILVDDKEKIQKIADASQQNFIAKADYVVVVCTDPKPTANAYEEHGPKFLKQQAGAAIQNFLLKLEEKKLATCWVGYFAEEIIKRELQIPDPITIEALFPIGYESGAKGDKKSARRKTNLDKILYFNKYKEKRMNPLKKINV